jgi:eukaryotic-like serine/threonine-protein kinase
MSKLCPKCGNTFSDASIFCPSDGSTLRPADDSGDLVGTVIADRYLIMQKLGEGGMGRVYLAQHVRLPQQAAIKVLSPALVNDTEALARFNREASNACRINAQHVARVYDFGETGTGLVYLAMEYVPGVTLSALLKTEGSLPPSRAANLTSQVAEGLEAAHKLGIVHRDLKPDNILVTAEADGMELAKVVDFGIAKAIDGVGQSVTRAGIVLGTAQFMSPEQVIGHVVDRRTDVYALGIVAFMMLTGKLPFEADTAEEAMFKRLSEPPRRLADERPDVGWPPGVQNVLDRALARELNDRYATASELATELRSAIDAWQHQPAVAVAVAVAPRAARPTWLRYAPLAGGAAVVLLAVIAVGVFKRSDHPVSTASGAVLDSGAQKRDSVAPRMSADSIVPRPSQLGPPTGTAPQAKQEGNRDAPRPHRDAVATDGPEMSAPATTRAADAARARVELENIVGTLHPDVITSTAARDAILALRTLLPRLGSAADTVKAELNRAGAYVYLEQVDQACAILRALAPKASPSAREQIEDQRGALGCQ